MSRLLPPAASVHAADIDAVLLFVHAMMVALFVGWSAYFVWVLVRFRRGRQPQASPTGPIGRVAIAVQVAVVIAELVLLIGVDLPTWRARAAAADPAVPPTLRIVAEQFAWNVHYPGRDGRFGATSVALVTGENPIGLDRGSEGGADDIVVQNQIHVAVNQPVVFQVSSKDVIHSFGAPAMRVKQDVIPGSRAIVAFTPTRLGTYDIACSQLCGLAHFRMRARLIVERADELERFLAAEAALLQ